MGGLAALFVVVSFVSAAFYVLDLRSAEAQLRSALRLLTRSEFAPALAALRDAEAVADRAARKASSPLLRFWMSGPFEDDGAALAALNEAASDLAGAGIGFVESSGVDDLSDVYRDSAFDLAAVGRVASAAARLRTDLAVTRAGLERVRGDGISAIARRTERALAQLDELDRGLERGVTFMEMVPGLMGATEPKRYFLALQSPSEARGGGGLIGVYGILVLDAGRLDLSHVGPIEELVGTPRRRIEAPSWFEQGYGPFGALEDPRLINLSPNFPATSQVLLDMYRAATGAELDGVIALDPLAIGELLRGTGPLRAPGWDKEITRANARRALLHDIYQHFDYREREQNVYLRGLIAAFMESLGADRLNVAGLVTGLSTATTRQHLKVFVVDPAVQQYAVELGIDGDYRRAGAGVQVLFNNNFSANKVDFFLKRTVHTDVRLLADGDAEVEVEVALTNEASEGRTVLVRPLNRALPFGANHMLLGLIAPRTATIGRVTAEGRTVIQIPRRDAGRPFVLVNVDVPAGATEEVVYRYVWPQAWDPTAGRFEFTLWPQAAVRPDFITLSVTPPPGVAFGVPRGWVESSGTTLEESGRLRAPFSVVLSAAGS